MWKNVLPFTVIFLWVTACAEQTIRTATSTATSHSSLVASFPQIVNTPSIFLEARFTGELVLNNGCLRVKNIRGNSVLLIWRPGFSTRTEQGVVQVLDSTGEVAASVGDFVEVGGGYEENPTLYGLAEPLPENCPGSYWIVGEWIKKIDKP